MCRFSEHLTSCLSLTDYKLTKYNYSSLNENIHAKSVSSRLRPTGKFFVEESQTTILQILKNRYVAVNNVRNTVDARACAQSK